MVLYKWVAVGSQWKTKPFPPTVHGVLLPSKPNVTIIYQQSGFDKRLKDLFLRFWHNFATLGIKAMTLRLDCSIKSICTIAKPKIDIYKF